MPDWHLARGYRYAGVPCGIRPDTDRLDLALVVSDTPAAAAGVFTQNCVVAAPVRLCRERLPAADARGVVVCSGNANACTGQQGLDDARRMAALAAQAAGCGAGQMLVCSTGVIGQPLPMPRIEQGIRTAAGQLAGDSAAFDRVAHAILTTDTRIKVSTRAVGVGGSDVRLTGFAKGAAMIGPNLATMLAFVLTDAGVAPDHLATLARRVADTTLNCVTVEGHTSTNDSFLLFANGRGPLLEGSDLSAFDQAAGSVCADLARAIAADAEGATHLITIQVEGLRDDAEARRVAKAVAESALVKAAVFGGDPNWGRIVSAAGYAGVDFREEQMSLWLGDLPLYRAGTPLAFEAATASAYLKNNRDVRLRLCFTLGPGACTVWTSDLSYQYVRLNAEYTT
ncbi:MAG TPA: bifunctional glutamate N-acetyltransferase/amino-acid acetyltransferase ArgJ [Gemmataceae bacterium]|jgi:glutamate N-acetyltransferase/amino-acid N-acetyltransferase|nr:bifunctional glutamate N-acetyltransferase/amino-acid acetyltransferase ArgJ [Gemmataceae bacterium]